MIDIMIISFLGWLILLCSLCVRRPADSEFVRKPHRPDPFPDIAATRIDRSPDLGQFNSFFALPYT